jgi:hypothetical protein
MVPTRVFINTTVRTQPSADLLVAAVVNEDRCWSYDMGGNDYRGMCSGGLGCAQCIQRGCAGLDNEWLSAGSSAFLSAPTTAVPGSRLACTVNAPDQTLTTRGCQHAALDLAPVPLPASSNVCSNLQGRWRP